MAESTLTLKSPPHKSDHHKGPLTASIVIVEYGDFQDPDCAKLTTVLDKIFKSYIDVCIIFRHFPLIATHPNAGVAAVAAEAAGKQGKFWEMHHALFAHQAELETENILNIAKELGLNLREFLNDLEDDRLLEKVRQDFTNGINNGVNATPVIFVNGVRFEGLPSFEELREEINQI
jgi:protein-disulfide isomerase